MDVVTNPEEDAKACRNIGAPLTFLCHQGHLLWWGQTDSGPYQIGEPVPANRLEGFFRENKDNFAPNTIYRAKTLGRFQPDYQRNFVDLGLMPLLEQETGKAIERLLLNSVAETRSALGWPKDVSLEQGRWLLKSVFWLLGAKMLHDKDVEGFIRLNFGNVDEVFERVATHYGESAEGLVSSQAKRRALEAVAKQIATSPSLQLATTEALAYVYENTLISKEVRAEFGTHSTPSYLVDYIVGRLSPWIEAIDQDNRSVFEPACGHSAFLVAAVRHLTSLLPSKMAEPAARKKYLRDRVRGYDADDFAVEIARLSLTLADIPNSNGWLVKQADLFESDLIEKAAKESTILLANPPFEDFKPAQRADYARKFRAPRFVNKTAEILDRALSALTSGGVFGVVVSENFLHSNDAKPLRQKLAKEFEIAEVCQFPDRVFNFAKKESAVLIGRKVSANTNANHYLNHRRVRVQGMEAFRLRYEASNEAKVLQTRFSQTNGWDLRVPELEHIWNSIANLPKFEDLADIGNGFIHLGQKHSKLPPKTVLVSDTKFPDAHKGYVRFNRGIQTHGLPKEVWVNLNPAVIFRPRSGIVTKTPQVLINFAPIQSAPWCLKALIDSNGHAVNSRFLIVRPRDATVTPEALWAICNSPFTNAYAFTHSTKREILAGTLREMRIPKLSQADVSRLTTAVRSYFTAVARYEEPLPLCREDIVAQEKEKLKLLHWRIDAELLRLYALPVKFEHELLNYLAGWKRAGVPFKQDRYFPEGFDEPISLTDYLAITADWEPSNGRRLKLIEKKQTKTISDQEKAELQELQRLAGLKRELHSSPSLKELAEMETDLRRRGLWKGA
jgi:type I restriction-modification system DNA methylase subunit